MVLSRYCLIRHTSTENIILNWNSITTCRFWGTRWRSCLRHCIKNRKVAGSIPDGVTGIFHLHNTSDRTMASNRKEYHEYLLGSKGGRCVGLITLPLLCADLSTLLSFSGSGRLVAYYLTRGSMPGILPYDRPQTSTPTLFPRYSSWFSSDVPWTKNNLQLNVFFCRNYIG